MPNVSSLYSIDAETTALLAPALGRRHQKADTRTGLLPSSTRIPLLTV